MSFALGILYSAGIAEAQLSFTATYSGLETGEEEVQDVGGIQITYPEDQGDILPGLLPEIARYNERRAAEAADEATIFRTVFEDVRANVESSVKTLLDVESLSPEFDESFRQVQEDTGKIVSWWEAWSGGVSEVHFYNHTTGKRYWKDTKNALEFPEIRYSLRENGQLNIALLPPFVNQFGTGKDKFRMSTEQVDGFRWDVGILHSPGTAPEVITAAKAEMLDSIATLQHQVSLQLGAKWLMRYQLEQLLEGEIARQIFTDDPANRHLIGGLARFLLFVHLNKISPDEMQMLLPNLVHFPLPRNEEAAFLQEVEQIDPFRPVADEYRVAAGRILMLGILKSSQQLNGDLLPVPLFRSRGIEVPDAGFSREAFLQALRSAYPDLDKHIIDARREIVAMMRVNFVPKPDLPTEAADRKVTPELPDSYFSKQFDGYHFTAPKSLAKAVDLIAPEWTTGLREASSLLRERFDRELTAPVLISDADLDALRNYGFTAERPEADRWALQTAWVSNLGSVVTRLFEGNKISIWLKEDLKKILAETGNTQVFEYHGGSGKVTGNFSFEISEKAIAGATVDDFLDRLAHVAPPVIPVVIDDDSLAEATTEEQIEAIRNGDYLIGKLIDGADEITGDDLFGSSTKLLNEREAFFVVVHEIVEGSLLRETIASDDRRWFCDGLSNYIAIKECDRRFGKGAGSETFQSLYPAEVAKRQAKGVNLLRWRPVNEGTASNSKTRGTREDAHYYFATVVLKRAVEKRGEGFVKEWIEEIERTPWIRTNAGTVFVAYQKLTGEDMRPLLKTVLK
ncbi:MAG: hypothetical protein MI807_20245 [Verrucomicrobiales bacterium]|nr:hypothetical protein [Verrucomicrobiales bacterium]